MNKKILSFLVIASLSVQFAVNINAEDEETEEYTTGMAIMSDERWAEFNSSIPTINGVMPNEIALSRVEENEPSLQSFSAETYTSGMEAVEIGDEISYIMPGGSSEGSGSAGTNFELASAVDVSESLTFPVIKDQGGFNSCVSWSLGYYQLTNNTCLVRGLNAKTESGKEVKENVMSPLWTYALTNAGGNYATYYDEACAAIMNYGVPTYSTFNSEITSSTIKWWSAKKSAWNEAMKNKPQQILRGALNISSQYTNNNDDVEQLKGILSNGYVVTIPVAYNSFVFTNRTDTSDWACKYAEHVSSKEGHALTIVGYDDDFWVDVNENRVRDEGEYGAFKVANSWGLKGKNCSDGYFWIAYDALAEESSVTRMPAITKVKAFTDYYLILPVKNYEPLLVANVEMSASDRHQIGVKIGISGVDENSPTELLSVAGDYNIAFNNAAESYLKDDVDIPKLNFELQAGVKTAVYPFDITPVIKKLYAQSGMGENAQIKVYVTLTDYNDDGHVTELNDVSVVEPISGNVMQCENTQALEANNSSVTKTVICNITPYVGSYNRQDMIFNFSSNILKSSVTNQTLYAKDYKNETVNLSYNVNKNKITIFAPNTGDYQYMPDSPYNIHIGSSVSSEGGNKLNANKIVPIYMLGKYYEWRK